MKKILIPTDFSDNANDAMNYTLNLFEQERCKYYHLHSVEVEVSKLTNLNHKFTQAIRENALLKLNKLKSFLTISNPNFTNRHNTILSFNSLVEAVKNAIKKHQIDLVVMGTKGASGLKKIFYGSNTVNVINKLDDCATLLIPDHFEFGNVTKIGFPTDLKTISSEAIEEIKYLSKLHNATIMIMHIMEEEKINVLQSENLKELKKQLEDVDYYFHPIPSYDTKSDEILDFIDNSEIDFLVITKNEHSFFEKLLRKPIIKKLGYTINIPLLVIPS